MLANDNIISSLIFFEFHKEYHVRIHNGELELREPLWHAKSRLNLGGDRIMMNI